MTKPEEMTKNVDVHRTHSRESQRTSRADVEKMFSTELKRQNAELERTVQQGNKSQHSTQNRIDNHSCAWRTEGKPVLEADEATSGAGVERVPSLQGLAESENGRW